VKVVLLLILYTVLFKTGSIKFEIMLELVLFLIIFIDIGIGAFGAGAASLYGSDCTKMMRLHAAPAPEN
jgi:hypothetical protein